MIAVTTHSGWRPGIGDPAILGWVTVIAYFAAAALCWRTRGRERDLREGEAHTGFWLFLSLAMLALGINKQLDLQTALTQIGRSAARAGGWYSVHRTVQAWFVAGVAGLGGMVVAASLWATRRAWRRCWLALLGLVFLVSFVAIRAASFHHVDALLGRRVLAVLRMNVVFELSGILLVGTGAILAGASLAVARSDRDFP